MYNKYSYFQFIIDYLEKLLNLFGYFFLVASSNIIFITSFFRQW